MTDVQIVKALATEVMGWPILRMLPPLNRARTFVLLMSDGSPSFYEHVARGPGDFYLWHFDWTPLTDPRDSKQIREKLAERWGWQQLRRQTDGLFRFELQSDGEWVLGSAAKTEERAVAEAALMSVERWKKIKSSPA